MKPGPRPHQRPAPHSHQRTQAHPPRRLASTASGPRKLAPAVMGRRLNSRHTALMNGATRWHYWFEFARNSRFWIIATVVSILTLSLLWSIKDLPAVPRPDWAAIRAMSNWKPTFFMREQPAVMENGVLVQPAETYYTVPSKLSEPPPAR